MKREIETRHARNGGNASAMVSRRTAMAIFAGGASLALVGCETKLARQQFPDLTYTHLAPIGLRVSRLDVASDYRSPLAPPNVEHRAPVNPERAARNWARDRLVAKGGTFTARFTVLDAAILEAALEQSGGLTGLFTTEQSERYTANLAVRLEIFDATGARRGFAEANAQRARTVAESATPNERDRVLFEMVEALMTDFNAEMERRIAASLAAYLA